MLYGESHQIFPPWCFLLEPRVKMRSPGMCIIRRGESRDASFPTSGGSIVGSVQDVK